MNEAGETEQALSDVLQGMFPAELFTLYRRRHELHFWLWKTHRICDHASLGTLRHMLYDAGVVALAPAAQIERDRPFHEYAAALGFEVNYGSRPNPFSAGELPHLVEEIFAQPDDCSEPYVRTRHDYVAQSIGTRLLYSLEATLVNCLREDLRSDEQARADILVTPTFSEVMRRLSILAEVDLAIQARSAEDSDEALEPFIRLCAEARHSGTVTWHTLTDLERRIQEWVDAERLQPLYAKHPYDVPIAKALGALIDELLARVAVPNCMRFAYESALRPLSDLHALAPSLIARARQAGLDSDAIGADFEALVHECRSRLEPSAPAQPLDADWSERVWELANRIRSLGYRGALLDLWTEDERLSIYDGANRLWRWIFFLEQRDSFECLAPSFDAGRRDRVCQVILRWLRRPWGILTIGCIDRSFRALIGDDVPEGSKKILPLFIPLLQGEPENLMADSFGIADPGEARALLLRFIRNRQTTYLLRRLVHHVQYEAELDLAAKARTLIRLFVQWLYRCDSDAREDLAKDVTLLKTMLHTGAWARDLLNESPSHRIGITASQSAVVQEYLEDPARFTAMAFLFDEPGFHIEKAIGFFPPEHFTFAKPGHAVSAP